MAVTVYICGDVHQPGGSETAFDRWLDQLAEGAPAHLVILGDLFDVWLETTAGIAQHQPTLRRLHRLRELGWRLDLVQGNRELAGRRRLAMAAKMPVHWPDLTLRVGPRRIRIVHGDRLCRDPGYHFFAAIMRSFWFQAAGRCLPGWCQDHFARWCRRRSQRRNHRRSMMQRQQSVSAPNHQVQGASALRLTPARLRAAARGVDSVVAGHIHQQWQRRLLGIDLLLVGDWTAHGGRWIEAHSDGRLVLTGSDQLG